MPKFDDPFVSYYELERENLLEHLERMQTGKWKVLDCSIPERIENTIARLARLNALADTLAAGWKTPAPRAKAMRGGLTAEEYRIREWLEGSPRLDHEYQGSLAIRS